MISMIRDERLHMIEEEPYKRGGKVRRKKSKKKSTRSTVRQTVVVNVGQTKPKRAVKRRQPTKRQQMMPGAPSALTGMGSVVFGAPQAPSYFRAVGSEQKTFASLPGSLKALEEGQTKLFRELERQKEQLRKDAKMARDIDEKEETTRKYVSPMSSRSTTPMMSFSTSVVPSPINTLNPLQRQRSTTPDIMTPMFSRQSSSIPGSAVRIPTWTGAMSSREAGYTGADETLPIQAPTSGSDMRPEDKVFDSAPDSAFVPLGASNPESIGDAVERASQVASYFQRTPGIRKLNIPRPQVERPPAPVPASSYVPQRSVSAPNERYKIPGMVVPRPKTRKMELEEAKRTVEADLAVAMARRKAEQPPKLTKELATKLRALKAKREQASKSGAV